MAYQISELSRQSSAFLCHFLTPMQYTFVRLLYTQLHTYALESNL